VRYEDRITIATPEGVDLELTLAGVGSRFTSAVVDGAIQFAIVVALLILGALLGTGWAIAAFTLLAFLLFAGYDIAFEVLASGRTPGKRLNGLRVVRTDGSPVGFLTSSIRNIIRLVDILPAFYLVGIIAVLVTDQNQRLGDLAAGTLVVRERLGDRRRARAVLTPQSLRPVPAAGAPPAAWATWDVAAISEAEIVAVRRFLERRDELTFEARAQLASELAAGLRPKVAGPPSELRSEEFLVQLEQAKAARG
jgi:uncharacterized RDD family membrane protein YckC